MQKLMRVVFQGIAIGGLLCLLLMLSIGEAFVYINELALVLILLLFAVCAYVYVNEIRLLRRHALLAYVFSAQSRTKRFLWDGFIIQFIHALVGWGIALSVFVLTLRLTVFEWAALTLGVPIFIALFFALRSHIGRELDARYQRVLVTRASLWATVLVIATLLSLLQVFFLEVPDTRHLNLAELTLQHWQAKPETSVVWLGHLVAALDVIYAALWHSLQLASSLPTGLSVGALLGIWLTFLILNGIQIGLVFTLILGLSVLLRRAQGNEAGETGVAGALARLKLGLIIGLLLPALLIAGALYVAERSSWWERPQNESAQATPVIAQDPCTRDRLDTDLDRLAEASDARLQQYSVTLEQAIERRLRVGLQQAFVHAEPAVDRFLDWNYSIRGQYQQIALLAAASVSEQAFSEKLGERLEQELATMLEPALLALNAQVDAEVATALRGVVTQQERWLQQAQTQVRCELEAISLAPVREQLHQSWVGTGAVGGALAWRLAAGAGTRAASRTGVRRAFAGLFTRAGARAAAAGGGASAGGFCGPMAWLCVPVLVTGSWLAVDYTMVEVDERLHRDNMRRAILDALAHEEERIYQGLREHYMAQLHGVLALMDREQREHFNIWRDGLGREIKETRRESDHP